MHRSQDGSWVFLAPTNVESGESGGRQRARPILFNLRRPEILTLHPMSLIPSHKPLLSFHPDLMDEAPTSPRDPTSDPVETAESVLTPKEVLLAWCHCAEKAVRCHSCLWLQQAPLLFLCGFRDP